MDATRLSVGAALVLGALMTAGVVWFAWPSGPSGRQMVALHQQSDVDGWVVEPSIERLHSTWSEHVGQRMLPVPAQSTLEGGAVIGGQPVWLYTRWQGPQGRVSVFATAMEHDRQPQWSCKPMAQRVELCQRTHQGWHVAMVRDQLAQTE